MFTVFMINGVPDNIYIVNSDHFEQALENREIDRKFVRSQELSLERLVRLREREFRVFVLCLVEGNPNGKVEGQNEGVGGR